MVSPIIEQDELSVGAGSATVIATEMRTTSGGDGVSGHDDGESASGSGSEIENETAIESVYACFDLSVDGGGRPPRCNRVDSLWVANGSESAIVALGQNRADVGLHFVRWVAHGCGGGDHHLSEPMAALVHWRLEGVV
jgi:hypothetical protein